MGLFEVLFRGGRRRPALAAAIEAAKSHGVSAAVAALSGLGPRDAADVLCELADYFQHEDDGEAARIVVLRALEREANHRGALERLVGLDQDRGDLNAAIAACRRLQLAAPSMLEPVTMLVELLLEAELPAKALAAIEESQ